MNADELLQAYARGERRFTYWRLIAADLHGADLRDANLYGSDLSNANLSGADLTRANLGKTDLYNANLSGANLSGAFYKDANLTRANMNGVITDNPSPALPPAPPSAPPPALTSNQPAGVVGGGTPLASETAVSVKAAQFCIHCGAQLPAGAQFCPRCGQAQVSAAPAASMFSAPSPITVPFVSPPPPASSPPAYRAATPSSAEPRRTTTSSQVAARSKAPNSLAITVLAITGLWDFIYKAAIVIVVIVGIVFFLKGCAANATLNEHSSCGQFEQADTDTQNRVLQDMMTAHHDTQDNLTLTRFSVTLYCNLYGPDAPIDGVYSSGDHSTQQRAQSPRRRGSPVEQMALIHAKT